MEATQAAKPVDPVEEDQGELRRAIGPRLLLFFIIGDILGGGIYALVGEVGGETGGAIWIAFTLALVMAAFTAGSYAELVSKYPRAGGAGLYVHRAFGPEVPPAAHSTDGAEMGKALVAEGVGVTVLPDYSVIGCPLHRVGMIESRPIAGNQTFVTLQLRQRKTLQQPLPVRELQTALVARAAEYRTAEEKTAGAAS